MRKNILFAFGVLVAASSCVHKEYDITGPIDRTMNVGGLIEMPVPGESSYSYTLGDILLPDNAAADGVLKKLDDGSFRLVFEPSEGLNESYAFPQIEAEDYSKTEAYPEGDTYFYSPGPGITWPGENPSVDVKLPLNLLISGIDSRVDAIREAELDATVNVCVNTPEGANFRILKDFRFSLPDYMYVDESRLQSFMKLEGHSTIVITGDMEKGRVFSFACHVIKLDMNGLKLENADGKDEKEIRISSTASAAGRVEFTDFTLKSGSPFKVQTVINISNIKAKTVTFKASPVIECAPQNITINDIPEIFTDGSLNFELDDIMFHVTAKNGTPFDFTVSTGITAYSDGQQTGQVNIDASDALTVKANSENQNFCLSESGKYGTDSETKISVPGISGLASPLPDRIYISGTKVSGSAGGDGYVTVHADGNYPVGLNYSIEAPLSFKSLTLRRDENIDVNLDLGDDISFDDIFIKASFTSTLPLDASLTFDLIDSEGKAMQGVSLKYEDENGNELDALKLPAGSFDAQSSRTLKLVAVADKGMHISKIQSLRLHIDASSLENSVVTLNAKQSLSVSDIIVGTNSGVFIDGDKQYGENL